MRNATLTMERIAFKWRDLAERRRAHLIELFQSGRWKHYYTEREFLTKLQAADAIAQRWAKIAPGRDGQQEQTAEQRRLAA